MLRSAVRSRALPFAGLAGVTVLLLGCGAGQNAQTAVTESSVPGVRADAGDIALRNVQVAYPGREQRSYPSGGNAPLDLGIFNTGDAPDTLLGVSSAAARSVVLVGTGSTETTEVCPAARVSLSAAQPAPASPTGTGSPAGPATPTGGTQQAGDDMFSIQLVPGSCALLDMGQPYHLELTGLREPISPGGTVPVTFTFRNAGDVTLEVPLGMPSAPPEHSPLDIHPVEPPAVGGHDTEEGDGH